MSNKDQMGDRMKQYEFAAQSILPRRMPIILRLDGKSFSNYTKPCQKPYDLKLIDAMNAVGIELCRSIQGAQIGFVQSDEVSILIHGYKRHRSQPWFDNEIQKIVSVSAGIASAAMTKESINVFGHIKPAVFDSRVFVIPEADVNNAFLWRQKDWIRNSIQMMARSYYSDKQCLKKSKSEMINMIKEKGADWNSNATFLNRGRCIVKRSFERNGQLRTEWSIDNEIPIFSNDTNYIEQYLKVDPEEKTVGIFQPTNVVPMTQELAEQLAIEGDQMRGSISTMALSGKDWKTIVR